MSSTSPIPNAQEQRLLAAIVFTDVASFSARMQTDEDTTLRLLERDFAVMRKLSTRFAGTVMKSTGDGLLLYFTSAVRAVAWAVRTQRQLAEQAKTLPPTETLQHRIGIHLGDVFVSAQDVMGDGVNIAARLQAEAPPGGICISQPICDLVKSKLKLNLVRLEGRKLKNISEQIQIYRVLLEPPPRVPPAPIRPPFEPAPTPAISEQSKPASRPRRLVVAGFLLVAMGVTGLVIVQLHLKQEEDLVNSKRAGDALTALIRAKGDPSGQSAPAPDAAEAKAAGSPTTAVAEPDFASLTRPQPAGDPGKAGDHEPVLRAAGPYLETLQAWLTATLPTFTRARTLSVRSLDSRTVQHLYTDRDGALHLVSGGGATDMKRAWSQLRPTQQGEIILAALDGAREPPPAEVVRGAGAFAYVHGLPEMAKALVRKRGAP